MFKRFFWVILVSTSLTSLANAQTYLDEAWHNPGKPHRTLSPWTLGVKAFAQHNDLHSGTGKDMQYLTYGFATELGIETLHWTTGGLELGIRGRFEDRTGSFPNNLRDMLFQGFAQVRSAPDFSRLLALKGSLMSGIGTRRWIERSTMWVNTMDLEASFRLTPSYEDGVFCRNVTDFYVEGRGSVAKLNTLFELGYRAVKSTRSHLMAEYRIFGFIEGGGLGDETSRTDVTQEHMSLGGGAKVLFHKVSITPRGGYVLFSKASTDRPGEGVERAKKYGIFVGIDLTFNF